MYLERLATITDGIWIIRLIAVIVTMPTAIVTIPPVMAMAIMGIMPPTPLPAAPTPAALSSPHRVSHRYNCELVDLPAKFANAGLEHVSQIMVALMQEPGGARI